MCDMCVQRELARKEKGGVGELSEEGLKGDREMAKKDLSKAANRRVRSSQVRLIPTLSPTLTIKN
jgi:hypothetical protein